MKIKVYDGEYFERSRLRYLIFGLCIIAILLLSVWYENILGAIVLLMIVWAYLFFQQKSSRELQLELLDAGIRAGNKMWTFAEFQGFVVEMDKNTNMLHNLVLVAPKSVEIFTFRDKQEVIVDFCQKLESSLPQLEGYHQSFADKVLRKCKL